MLSEQLTAPMEIEIVELDDGALEHVLGGTNWGCNNTKDCRGSDNSNCTNSSICLVGCAPA